MVERYVGVDGRRIGELLVALAAPRSARRRCSPGSGIEVSPVGARIGQRRRVVVPEIMRKGRGQGPLDRQKGPIRSGRYGRVFFEAL